MSKIKQSMAQLLKFKGLKFGGQSNLGFKGRWISITVWILQNYTAAAHKISVKSNN